MSGLIPGTETVDGESTGGAHFPTSGLPETGRTSLVVPAFGEPIQTITDCNASNIVAWKLDTPDLTSSAQQGMGGVGRGVKDLPSDLILIDPAESLDVGLITVANQPETVYFMAKCQEAVI